MRAAAAPRKGWIRSFFGITLGRMLKWLLIAALLLVLLLAIAFAIFVYWPTRGIPNLQRIDDYLTLDQGWGAALDSKARQTYYYSGQGAVMPQGALSSPLRYDWFIHLELPLSTDRFAAPEHMRRYRFIVDPQPSAANPDHLPVGFTQHFDPQRGERMLDISCAACHSGEIHAEKDGRRIAIRIDGGQAMHAFTSMQRGSFGPTLIASLAETYLNPGKFTRFARKVLGENYPQGRSELHSELGENIVAFASLGQDNPIRQLYPVTEGYGRTDALGRIANTVFGDHINAANYHQGRAPVSYPYLWNIWKFDWVQYNGSVRQPLARNIGEAMGVGAVMRMTDTYGKPLPADQRFRSSVLVDNLIDIEHTLQTLTPPRWPEDLLGAVDQARAERGRQLFEDHCQRCHGPHVADPALQRANAPLKTQPGTEWIIRVIDVEQIGTDPTAAEAFMKDRFDLSATGIDGAQVAEVLRPLLIRNLARDTRYRLSSVITARTAAGEPLGELPQLLQEYPDLDNAEQATLPTQSFAAIAAALGGLGIDSQADAVEPPSERWGCEQRCQQDWLSWNVHGAQAAIDRSVAELDVSALTEGEGLNILGLLIKRRYYQDNGIDYPTQQCLEGFGTLDLPQQIAGYKPRPLEGVWATPPFLHNGSVPTIYEMLLPPEQRRARFLVGSRDYDSERLGYVVEPDDPAEADAGFWLDTSVAGNYNSGHAFVADADSWARFGEDPQAHPLPKGVIGPLLSDEQRYELVEYLKIHRDPPTPAEFRPADCANRAPADVLAEPEIAAQSSSAGARSDAG